MTAAFLIFSLLAQAPTAVRRSQILRASDISTCQGTSTKIPISMVRNYGLTISADQRTATLLNPVATLTIKPTPTANGTIELRLASDLTPNFNFIGLADADVVIAPGGFGVTYNVSMREGSSRYPNFPAMVTMQVVNGKVLIMSTGVSDPCSAWALVSTCTGAGTPGC